MSRSVKPLQERFWEKVVKTSDCWLWTGDKHPFGYGRIWVVGKGPINSHRVSWEIHNGPIPKGKHILHICDNPVCVRPDHLQLGSQADNVQDMLSKDRNGNAKMNSIAVKVVRFLYHNRNVSIKRLANAYNLKYCSMWDVINRSWKYIA